MPAVATASVLEEKSRSKCVLVGVIGLGHMGLSLVAGFARSRPCSRLRGAMHKRSSAPGTTSWS